MDANLAVDLKQICMLFPKVLANDHVDFSVRKGEIHALVGENGAGKSTLMNVLYGMYHPTSGEIYINGQHKSFDSPIDAISTGIGMVHQHFMLIPMLSVLDNIVLGSEPTKNWVYDRKTALEEVTAVCEQYHLDIDLQAKVSNISIGMQQRVEIIKSLYRKAEILILDEPTAVLTPQEIHDLGVILQDLKKSGKTIIIITHKLKEIMDFSDRVTVLRRGQKIATVNTEETSPKEITYMMVGRDVDLSAHRETPSSNEDVLRIENINYTYRGKQLLKNVSLTLKRGEILGIAGIDGSGQNELVEIIAGQKHPDSGTVVFSDTDISHTKTKVIRGMGMRFIPQDRQKMGMVKKMSIAENMLMGCTDLDRFVTKAGFLKSKVITEHAVQKIKDYDIRAAGSSVAVGTLSGGNQQKVILAREISEDAVLILANQPTRGVDVGAAELINASLVKSRNDGKAVMLVSLELDEVMTLSDRIAVFYDGAVMDVRPAEELTRESIGLLMAGKQPEGGQEV